MLLPDDIFILEKEIDNKYSLRCIYDIIMDAFVIRLLNSEGTEQGIGLRLLAIKKKLLRLIPRLLAIRERYNDRDMAMFFRFKID